MEQLNSIAKTEGNVGYNQVPQGHPQHNQYLYLQIQTDHGQPLTPTLFTKDVIEGMVSMQGHVVGQEQEPPLEVMLLSETEAVIEFSSRTNIERIAVWQSSSVLVGAESAVGLQTSCTRGGRTSKKT